DTSKKRLPIMREHPIPQDITGYKFHIIGSMTLKQFVEIALGVGLGGLIYSTNLPEPVKWPLIIFSVAIGGMVAFLPIEERPLDHWIITFIRVMYRPTQFFWKREAIIPDFFNFTPNMNTSAKDDFDVDFTPYKKERIREYLTSVPSVTDPYAFDSSEVQRMDAILNSFSSVDAQPAVVAKKIELEKPQLGVRVRNFRPQYQERVVYQDDGQGNMRATVPGVTDVNQELAEMYTKRQQLAKQQKSARDVAQEVAIPETELIAVVDPAKQAERDEAAAAQPQTTPYQMSYATDQADNTTSPQAVDEAEFNINLPFPEPPTEPNKLVGMVLSQNNDLIVNAIIEIIKPDGTVARAVKTNALGQFFVTTPLDSGDYTLSVEKDGFIFEPMSILLTGTQVEPIEIRSVS
ncbi:PrgI family protein, partial [Candidatus Woesebacteria bacterium]|nr:PrgI family protein [Candidatus Woesebacteria bacterium]